VPPRGLRRGQVNFRSFNSCLLPGASSPGRRRARVLFGVSFRGGYYPTGIPGDTVWLAFPPTGRGWLGVMSLLVEQQGRKATQPSSGRWGCANPPRGEPSWYSSRWILALRAEPRNARVGWVQPGRWQMGGGMETPLVSTCLVPGGMGLPPPEAERRWTIATPVQVPRMRVPAGSGLCSSP